MFCSWQALIVLLVSALLCQPTIGKNRQSLDISGTYDQTHERRCKCWGSGQCNCVHEGCTYVERFTFGPPDADGYFAASIGGQDRSCFNNTVQPFTLSVDSAGRVLGGFHFEGEYPAVSVEEFNPLKLEQEMDMVVVGNVFGFSGGPPAHRAIVIERHNVTVCDTREFLDGKCEPGHPRYICRDVFSYCSGGNCLTKNLDLLSPKKDAFFSPFSATALNGTYELSPHESSPDCPKELSVYQFGSQVGIGASQRDMHLARVVDTSMAWEEAGSVQFQTQCSGIEWHMDMAVAGEIREEQHAMEMTLYLMLPWHDEGRIEVEKCVMRRGVAPRLFAETCHNNATVIVLGVLLMLACIVGGVLAGLFLFFRRKYIETKITRQYEIFQG